MQKLRVSILVATSLGVSWALVTGCHVDPRTAAMSGWTHRLSPDNRVSQTVTCNFDGIVYCELFVGGYSGSSAFKVDVYEIGGGIDPVAYNSGVSPAGEHRWLRLDLTTGGISGTQYLIHLT